MASEIEHVPAEASFKLDPPLVCEDFPKDSSSEAMSSPQPEISESIQTSSPLRKLQMENELQKKELSDTKGALVKLKAEYIAKNRECQEAWKSLNELKNELMRKSMHVGSLAFAIEGQVKEKSKWFSSLSDLTRKLNILKMNHSSLVEEASLFQHYQSEMEGLRSAIQSAMQQHLQSNEAIGFKFMQAEKERKELYNKVVEMKGNIRVLCRCRPFNAEETEAGASMAADFEAAKDGEIILKSNGIPKKSFKFDAVFPPEAEQVDVFQETAPLANCVLDGYNVCIFAYGQTGSGKTFTMEGTTESRGVNFRTLKKLFDIIEERKSTFHYEVSVSVLEIYNESIRDLLASDSHRNNSVTKRLEIKQMSEGGHHVPGLVEAHVKNVDEVWEVLQRGSQGRSVGLTNANEHSSRSHCIHCVMGKAESLINGESTRSKLWLVDLAGSERIAKTEVQGERLKETQNINRSLSALGDVISALATKTPHIPFRNSKLTHLLQDSLGGDSKALMIVQISPNESDLNETLCSLNFASRVRGVELGPAKKQIDKSDLFKHKQMAEKLRQDLKGKESQVKKLEDTNFCLEVKIKDRDMKNRSLQEKIKELESQLLVERKLARQHVDARIAEQLQQHPIRHEDDLTARYPLSALSEWKASENQTEFSFFPPCMTENRGSVDKENYPETAEQLKLPRSLLCPQKISKLSPLLKAGEAQGPAFEMTCLPEQMPCESPISRRNIIKKMTSGLRRSIQKKRASPMQPPLRRLGVNVCTEKLRVSIGRGRNGQRIFLGDARRAAAREALQKQSQREKERGWNVGGIAAARTLL